MCKEEVKINEELEEQEYVSESEEVMEQIAVNEELKRIEFQDNPTSVISDFVDTKIFKGGITVADTVGQMFQKLIRYGIDYNSALAIASGYIQNCATLEITKEQVTAQKDSQI